ncbi:hypothetical protein KSP39_PZI008036 [Platanthera zijinensis]|uniref:Uncharacterized protein n=1 Tax=Platanthera zijinensis TaxID=2320716 RepID=A0AAP0BP26_9ASPA
MLWEVGCLNESGKVVTAPRLVPWLFEPVPKPPGVPESPPPDVLRSPTATGEIFGGSSGESSRSASSALTRRVGYIGIATSDKRVIEKKRTLTMLSSSRHGDGDVSSCRSLVATKIERGEKRKKREKNSTMKFLCPATCRKQESSLLTFFSVPPALDRGFVPCNNFAIGACIQIDRSELISNKLLEKNASSCPAT